MSYKIHLDNFEGPLDLLLYFIRRDELDIYDIPIAKITRDFINVIEEWKKLNILIAGDFIVMASTLMRIKARIMIPRPDIDEDGEIIDPRTELMQQLINYRRYRDAAGMLENLAIERKNFIPRQFKQEVTPDENSELGIYFRDISLYELARLFKVAMENRPVISQFELNREPIKLEKQKELIMKFFDGEGRIKLNNLISTLKSKMEIIVTFLAVLDLVKEGICTITQSEIFGQIELINLGMKS
tara:strand:- start:1428 stop:2156 length:729 start_codon:yes stop_codon:yes gene_type:complete